MQDIKRGIDVLALMNVKVDFDELSIRVLNGLGPEYCIISHAQQARDTHVTFEELFEQLLSYDAQLKSSPMVLPTTPVTALVDPTGILAIAPLIIVLVVI